MATLTVQRELPVPGIVDPVGTEENIYVATPTVERELYLISKNSLLSITHT